MDKVLSRLARGTSLIYRDGSAHPFQKERSCIRAVLGPVFILVLLVNVLGCRTPQELSQNASPTVDSSRIHAGDVLKVSFPEIPDLNATQKVTDEGKISLAMVGDIQAAGQTPTELETRVQNLISSRPEVRVEFAAQTRSASKSITLREGDVLNISFPSAQNLNTTQRIRRDGRIALAFVGEVQATDLTPSDLEKELVKLYASQLTSKEVTVSVESSSLPVFVTGAVLHPGKIVSDHPITALEAVMEAGGFDYARAKVSAVSVVRHEDRRVKTFILNMKPALNGKSSDPFYLEPSDIIYVPEKFTWF